MEQPQGPLAIKLRVLRAERGLTIEEAAEKAKVTPETISDAERGKRHPYLPTLRKIAKGYGVPVEALLEAEEARRPKKAGPPKAGTPQEEPGQSLEEKAREWAQEAGGDRRILHGMDDEAWDTYFQNIDTAEGVSETYHKMQEEKKMLRALWEAHKMQHPQARDQRRKLARGLRELRKRRYRALAGQAAQLRARDLVEEIFDGVTEEEMAESGA